MTPTTYTGTNGLFVCTYPTKESIQILRPLLDFGSATEQDRELHCTIVYSPTAVPPRKARAAIEASPKIFEAHGYQIDMWDGHDKAGYVVLKLTSWSLEAENRVWRNLGATSSFDDYKPHVTLAKDLDLNKVARKVDQLNDMIGRDMIPLIFKGLAISDFKR